MLPTRSTKSLNHLLRISRSQHGWYNIYDNIFSSRKDDNVHDNGVLKVFVNFFTAESWFRWNVNDTKWWRAYHLTTKKKNGHSVIHCLNMRGNVKYCHFQRITRQHSPASPFVSDYEYIYGRKHPKRKSSFKISNLKFLRSSKRASITFPFPR